MYSLAPIVHTLTTVNKTIRLWTAYFLITALFCPSPALALRQTIEGKTEAGLEEVLQPTQSGLEEWHLILPRPQEQRVLPSYEAMVDEIAQAIREGRREKKGGLFWVCLTGRVAAGKTMLSKALESRLLAEGFHLIALHEDELGLVAGSIRNQWEEEQDPRWYEWREGIRWEKILKTLQKIEQRAALAKEAGQPQSLLLDELFDTRSRKTTGSREVVIHPDTVVLFDGFLLPEKFGAFDHWVLLDAEQQESQRRQVERKVPVDRDEAALIKMEKEVHGPAWEKHVRESHPETKAHAVYDTTDLNRPVRLIYGPDIAGETESSAAGLEEKTGPVIRRGREGTYRAEEVAGRLLQILVQQNRLTGEVRLSYNYTSRLLRNAPTAMTFSNRPDLVEQVNRIMQGAILGTKPNRWKEPAAYENWSNGQLLKARSVTRVTVIAGGGKKGRPGIEPAETAGRLLKALIPIFAENPKKPSAVSLPARTFASVREEISRTGTVTLPFKSTSLLLGNSPATPTLSLKPILVGEINWALAEAFEEREPDVKASAQNSERWKDARILKSLGVKGGVRIGQGPIPSLRPPSWLQVQSIGAESFRRRYAAQARHVPEGGFPCADSARRNPDHALPAGQPGQLSPGVDGRGKIPIPGSYHRAEASASQPKRAEPPVRHRLGFPSGKSAVPLAGPCDSASTGTTFPLFPIPAGRPGSLGPAGH